MDSPKERVRANIYKSLLEQEKRRNKKISVVSVSLFVVGIFTGVSYTTIKTVVSSPKNLVAFENKNGIKKEAEFAIDDLFQNNEIKVNRRDFDTEKLFVSDLQI